LPLAVTSPKIMLPTVASVFRLIMVVAVKSALRFTASPALVPGTAGLELQFDAVFQSPPVKLVQFPLTARAWFVRPSVTSADVIRMSWRVFIMFGDWVSAECAFELIIRQVFYFLHVINLHYGSHDSTSCRVR